MQAAQRHVRLNFGIGVDFVSGYLLVSNWGYMLSSDAGLFPGLNVGWAPSHAPWPNIAQPSSVPAVTCENTTKRKLSGPRLQAWPGNPFFRRDETFLAEQKIKGDAGLEHCVDGV